MRPKEWASSKVNQFFGELHYCRVSTQQRTIVWWTLGKLCLLVKIVCTPWFSIFLFFCDKQGSFFPFWKLPYPLKAFEAILWKIFNFIQTVKPSLFFSWKMATKAGQKRKTFSFQTRVTCGKVTIFSKKTVQLFLLYFINRMLLILNGENMHLQ